MYVTWWNRGVTWNPGSYFDRESDGENTGYGCVIMGKKVYMVWVGHSFLNVNNNNGTN